jgi:hypothetical protein
MISHLSRGIGEGWVSVYVHMMNGNVVLCRVFFRLVGLWLTFAKQKEIGTNLCWVGLFSTYLLEQFPERDQNLALSTELVWTSRILRNIESRNAQSAASPSHTYQVLQHNIWLLFLATLVDSLIANSVDSTIHHAAISLDDLVHSIRFAKVDRGALRDFRGS